MKKIPLIIFLSVILPITFFARINLFNANSNYVFAASDTKAIVACTDDCNFDSLMATINNIINFLLFIVATPLFAIGFCYAGVLYMFSGGSSENVGTAKSIIKNLFIGYLLALLAWVIVKTIMVSLGFSDLGLFLNLG
ncbi:MAG: pilin [Candidatus Nomurabacteria bacterium]|nr:pilin [Candidatus Nomurabacteria bacterium]